MRHRHYLTGVGVFLQLVATLCFFGTASAGDPDNPTGKHHGSSAQVTIGPIANHDQGLNGQDRFHVSLAGDPGQPTGPGHHGSSANIGIAPNQPVRNESLSPWRFLVQAFKQLLLF